MSFLKKKPNASLTLIDRMTDADWSVKIGSITIATNIRLSIMTLTAKSWPYAFTYTDTLYAFFDDVVSSPLGPSGNLDDIG